MEKDQATFGLSVSLLATLPCQLPMGSHLCLDVAEVDFSD